MAEEEGRWVTIKGTHVLIGREGKPIKGGKFIEAAREGAGLNIISTVKMQYQDAIDINGNRFHIYEEATEIWDEKNFRPKKQYFIHVSPEYNPTANFKIAAKSINSLVKELQKLDYKIVKPRVPRGWS